MVAKEAVELTDARCPGGDGGLGLRVCVAADRSSCAIEFRVLAVLFRVAILRGWLSLGFDVDVCRCGASFRS
jgi:hypothetical protein